MLCPGCGNPTHETMDPALEMDWVAPLPMRCHACTAVERRMEEYSESRFPRALRFRALRRNRVAATQ